MSVKTKSKEPLIYRNPIREFQGFTLFTPLSLKMVYLIEMNGRVAHKWGLPLPASYDVRLLKNGNLLYMARIESSPSLEFEGCGGKLIELDWSGKIVWEYEDKYMHHSFFRKRNGNTVFLKWIKVPDHMVPKIKGGIAGTERKGNIWTDSICEVNKYGRIIYEWNAYEHLDIKKNIICPIDFRSEWTHANSLFVMDNEDILVNFMLTNTICIIDKETGKIKWSWDGEVNHAHSISELENGNILLFDNGLHAVGYSFSRVIEIDPDIKKIVWEYKEDSYLFFYSSMLGSAQRLDNGNTIICDSTSGRIFEVTIEKEVVWEYLSPYRGNHDFFGFNNIIVNATRYSPEYQAFKNKEWLI